MSFYSSKPPLFADDSGRGVLGALSRPGLDVRRSKQAVLDRSDDVVHGELAAVRAGRSIVLSRWIDRMGTTDWGRLYALAAACFGTPRQSPSTLRSTITRLAGLG